ncbi:MAG TPA: NAD(+)/NADH kinase [Syntrophomonadaceae bacterium]|nr:NAD(+)/NADH kinase [Syntrophomonadaceae bacterium]
MKQLGLVVNLRKARGGRFLDILVEWFEQRGVKVVLPQSTELMYIPPFGCPEIDFQEEVDVIMVLGGDGTLLGVARQVADKGIPILGVNLGQLGFLTDLEMPDLFPCLEKLVENDYEVESRMMLEAQVLRKGSPVKSMVAFNDVVIGKGPISRIIRLETYVGSDYLATYRADGIIVASPTGSTAYSLSAGGPIVNPELEVMIVTPICPHTLHARPIILSDKQEIRVIMRTDTSEVMLTIDGQVGLPLQKNDSVVVRKADVYTRLVKVKNRSFSEVLRLKFRGGNK